MMIDLATLGVVSGALNTSSYGASASDLIKFLEYLDNEEFEVRRKPIPVIEPVIEPAPMVPAAIPIPPNLDDQIQF